MAFTADLKTHWRAILICAFITLAAFQFGYDSSYYSGILAMQPFLQIYGHFDPKTNAYMFSASQQSLTTSIINAGEFVGAATAWFIGDRFGRRGGLFVSSAFVVVGTTIQLASTEIASLIVGRLALGYAVGLISCFVPLYVADCAPACFRGALVSMYQFCLGQGLLLGVIVDYATHDRPDTGSFRIPMAVQYIFPLLLVPGLLLLAPESPRWLVAKGRPERAASALQKLSGNDRKSIEDDLAAISADLAHDQSLSNGSWKSLFTRGPDLRKAYLGFALQALQQGTGINFVTSYGIVFFIQVGIQSPFLIQLGLYLIAMPAVWFSQYGIERFGRRPLLIVSGLLTAAILIAIGGCGLAFEQSGPHTSVAKAVVAMVYLFLVVFNLAWGPTVWVVTSELATGPNRDRLMSLSTCTNWFFTWLITFTYPYLANADGANLGPKIGFLYGALTLMAVGWVWCFLPETSGRSLEQIHALFEMRVPAREFASKTSQVRLLLSQDVLTTVLETEASVSALDDVAMVEVKAKTEINEDTGTV